MSELSSAIKQICDEKALSFEAVITTIESALAAAYRKDFGEKNQNIKVEFDPETGESKVFDVKTVVEDMPEEDEEEVISNLPAGKAGRSEVKSDEKIKSKGKKEISDKKTENKKEDKKVEAKSKEDEEEVRRFNPRTEIQISDAKLIKKTAKINEEIITKLPIPDAYGRMAAQTAKQVIIQKLREAERDMIYNEFKNKEHEVISGVVQRREGRAILVDLGKVIGILLADEQIYNEKYNPGQRIKVYVKEVNITPKGPEIILSRTSDEILKKVFYLEIPEISNGLVEIKSVAREAGSRSKVAVSAVSDNVDPIGSCVGQRGARIQTIISELGGEKIDIIEYDEDIKKFIANALSPAKVLNVEPNEKEKKAITKVTEDQLSLAIGKAGQNVRLAARLTGWRIDISGDAPNTPNTPKDAKETAKDEKGKKEEEAGKDKKEENKKEESENTCLANESRRAKTQKQAGDENTEKGNDKDDDKKNKDDKKEEKEGNKKEKKTEKRKKEKKENKKTESKKEKKSDDKKEKKDEKTEKKNNEEKNDKEKKKDK